MSRFTQEFCRIYILRLFDPTTTSRSKIGDVTPYVQISVDVCGGEGVVWDSGSSKVADKSYLLYLLLFFTWRLNGSHFLIEKHAVNARRGCFYSQKNRTASASTRARICRICMKFVAQTRRTFYGIIVTTSLECQFEAYVNALQDGLRQRITPRELSIASGS